jgi:acyl carrier protein
MEDDKSAIEAAIKEFILTEFLPGENPAALTSTTALVTTGILDSIATLKVVGFLEERYGVTIAPHEMDVENLNTVADMARLIGSKGGSQHGRPQA